MCVCLRSLDPSEATYSESTAHAERLHAKYRLPDGSHVQRKLSAAWTAHGRSPSGYFTKRTAEAWLDDVLVRRDARS
jgi:2-keto-4-pentenoate hydratase